MRLLGGWVVESKYHGSVRALEIDLGGSFPLPRSVLVAFDGRWRVRVD